MSHLIFTYEYHKNMLMLIFSHTVTKSRKLNYTTLIAFPQIKVGELYVKGHKPKYVGLHVNTKALTRNVQ